MPDLVDPLDFCRECRGTGRLATETERGTTLFDRCWMCGGSGHRTVAMFDATTTTLHTRLDAIFSDGIARAHAEARRPQ